MEALPCMTVQSLLPTSNECTFELPASKPCEWLVSDASAAAGRPWLPAVPCWVCSDGADLAAVVDDVAGLIVYVYVCRGGENSTLLSLVS